MSARYHWCWCPGVDNDDMMGAESGEEDKKEVCIQVKLGKEEKAKPSLDR